MCDKNVFNCMCTYSAMQCAAVNTCVEDIKLAPQY